MAICGSFEAVAPEEKTFSIHATPTQSPRGQDRQVARMENTFYYQLSPTPQWVD